MRPVTLSASASRPARRLISAMSIASAVVLLFIDLGYESGTRVMQLAALALPPLLWLLWPVKSERLHRVRALLVWLSCCGFVLDAVVRAWLFANYRAAPDSAMILGAAANTTAQESREFISMYATSLLAWGLALAGTAALLAWCVLRGARHGQMRSMFSGPALHPRMRRLFIGLLALLLLLGAVAHASKPWRRLHPLVFWTQWDQKLRAVRTGWADHAVQRAAMLARARAAAPKVDAAGPRTVLLIIGESINRDNMSLYGYGRATTPGLQQEKVSEGNRLAVLRHAWSSEATTLPSLTGMFGFGSATGTGEHALALARAAGYKVWWVSNHDDLAIEQLHARFADSVEFINHAPGRTGTSLDGELIDDVQEAIADPSPRKLIVVHLLGAHPHYTARFPANANPFDDRIDEVEQGMQSAGRSILVRHFRNEYDAAVLYHDKVVDTLLDAAQAPTRRGEARAFMYLSDHGQEVGHVSDRAGHSPSTASGYRIPAMIWRDDGPTAAAESRPFRADWAAWTLMDLLAVKWAGNRPDRSVLQAQYRWQPPVLPLQVRSFLE